MITKILVAVDHTRRAPFVLDAASKIADRFDAGLRLFRAIPVFREFQVLAASDATKPYALPDWLRAEALEQLQRLAVGHERALAEPPIVAFGQPAELILEAAEESRADLIVIGSHGLPVDDRWLGSRIDRAANRARRNVFVVDAFPFDSIPPPPM